MEILLAVVAVAALALGLWVWLRVVWRLYRPTRPHAERIPVIASDGWRLALYRRAPAVRRFEEPLLLCHGLAANHRNMDFEPPYSLAMYLADAGFECFSVDWRGTGGSRGAPKGRRNTDYSVDDHIERDGPAFLEEALRRTGARRAFWVGHSLGGLVGYAVAGGPAGAKLAGIVSLGSPAFFRYSPLMAHILKLSRVLAWPFALRQRWFSVMTAPFLGHVTLPLTEVVLNPEHIPAPLQRRIYAQVVSSTSRRVLVQFDRWLRRDRFESEDGKVDYRARLEQLSLPLLVTGCTSDALAPPEVVRLAFEVAGSEDKTLLLFGKQNGDAMDYGHGDLIFGRGAPLEVFPHLRRWLEARATPYPG